MLNPNVGLLDIGGVQCSGVVSPFSVLDLPVLGATTSYTTAATYGMGCLSPDIAVKYPVSCHLLPDPPSRTPEAYESQATVWWRRFCQGTCWISYVPGIWREMRIGKTFSFRATTKVVGARIPPRER